MRPELRQRSAANGSTTRGFSEISQGVQGAISCHPPHTDAPAATSIRNGKSRPRSGKPPPSGVRSSHSRISWPASVTAFAHLRMVAFSFRCASLLIGMLGIPASPPRLVTSLARGHQPRANAETSTVMFAKPAKSTEAYLTCLSLIHWAFFLSAVASQTRCTAEIVAFSPIL